MTGGLGHGIGLAILGLAPLPPPLGLTEALYLNSFIDNDSSSNGYKQYADFGDVAEMNFGPADPFTLGIWVRTLDIGTARGTDSTGTKTLFSKMTTWAAAAAARTTSTARTTLLVLASMEPPFMITSLVRFVMPSSTTRN